jgi:prefoldin beta subunit
VVAKFFTKIEEQLLTLKLNKMSNSTKINQLQMLQQNLQSLVMQKQQVQNQSLEIESALTELRTTDKAYKIVGKIMLASSKESLIKDLEEKKEVSEVRLKTFKDQEESLQKNIDNTQKEVMEELKEEKNEQV